MALRVPHLCLLLSLTGSIAAAAQNAASQVRTAPLQARLNIPIDTRQIKSGTPIFASALAEWKGPDCHLRAGSTLYGHVFDLESKADGGKDSHLTIAFDKADCNRSRAVPVSIVLYALIQPDETLQGAQMQDTAGLMGYIRPRPMMLMGTNSAGKTVPVPSYTPTSTGTTIADDANLRLLSSDAPTGVTAGEVVGVDKLKLELGKGVGGNTVLRSNEKAIHLTTTASLVFVAVPTRRVDASGAPVPASLKTAPITPLTAPVPEADPLLQLLDTNHDGVLSADEIAAASKILLAMDKNGDGKISAEEIAAWRKEHSPASEDEAKELANEKASEPAFPVLPPVDTTEVCNAGCDILSKPTDTASSDSELMVSLRSAGFDPKSRPELLAFDHDATVNFLSTDQVLVTFDTHRLREHYGESWNPYIRRSVRGVLFDTHSHRILRVVEWIVDGEGQYLWRSGPGRVILHRNGKLEEIGPDLKLLATVPAQGKIRWVSASLTGEHLAIGYLSERHTREAHEQIAHAVADPEEDIRVELIDAQRHIMGRSIASSWQAPPTLSDSGEFLIQPAPRGQWKILEVDWDRTIHSVATVTSQCQPTISPLPSSFFLRGCVPDSVQRWYRILSNDGRTLFKAPPSSSDVEQAAVGSANGYFAVRTVATTKTLGLLDTIHTEDLREESVDVYRAGSPQRLLHISSPTYPESEDSFDISPNGLEIAVLNAQGIAFYRTK